MTAAEAKLSPYWPADIKATEDVTDKYCPLALAYILKRPAPQVPVYITHPRTTEIASVMIIDIEDARRILDVVFGGVFASVKTPAMPWMEST